MALTINTNIASVSAQRHLNESRKELDIAMERLSSGQRINSAKDDAAGLAIRDKMSSQVVGLNQSIRNANDAISLAQTAEGAMEESVSILQRMRVLAMQAINDTNTDSDRANLNDEFIQLQLELTRIGITSSFNNVKLLDGTFTGSTFQVGPGASETIFLAINDQKANAIGTTYDVASFDIFAADSPAKGDSLSLTIRGADGDGGNLTVTYTSDKAETATQTAAGMVLALNSNPTFTEKYQALTDANNSILIRRTDGTSMGLPIRAQFDMNAAVANDTVAITVDGVATGGAAKTFTYTTGSGGLNAETAFEVATGVTATLNADTNGFGRFYKAYASSDGKVEIRTKDGTNVDTSKILVTQTTATFSPHVSSLTPVTNNPTSFVVEAVDHGSPGWTIVLSSPNQLNTGSVAKYTVNGNTYTQSFNTDLPTTLSLLGDKVVAGEPTYQSHNNQNYGYATHEHLSFVDTSGNQLDTPSGTSLIIETPAYVTATSTLNFNNLNLVEGDRITLNIAGGIQVQGVIGSDGLDALLTKMAIEVSAQTDLFSNAESSSNTLTIFGLTNGSAIAAVTVSLEAASVESTTINQIINEHTGFEVTVAPALNNQGALSVSNVVKAVDFFVDDTDVLSASAAMQAVRVVDDAVAMIGRERAGLGAFQNRLEHAMSNMANNAQNTQAARSVIADADYAKEAATLAKNQILQQAGTAMLAQANSQAETVLSLLK
jgi:flagellin